MVCWRVLVNFRDRNLPSSSDRQNPHRNPTPSRLRNRSPDPLRSPSRPAGHCRHPASPTPASPAASNPLPAPMGRKAVLLRREQRGHPPDWRAQKTFVPRSISTLLSSPCYPTLDAAKPSGRHGFRRAPQLALSLGASHGTLRGDRPGILRAVGRGIHPRHNEAKTTGL